jgi:phosphoribosylformylglycinamidine synthase
MFGEDQGRYLVLVEDAEDERFLERARTAGVSVRFFARMYADADTICVGDGGGGHVFGEVSLTDLRAAHEGFFPKLMGGELPVA